jgi:diadenosine tetraphosphate (Ap4A) HIT family hydrolase
MESCFLCRKHEGKETAPPGGCIYEDEHWMVCHAPGNLRPLGTLFIESKRHFLDYAEMTDQESASLGTVMRNAYRSLKQHTQAERVYQVTLLEGIPHFHSWLVPRRREVPEKGMKFLARDDSCSEEEASLLAENLRASMNER